MEIADYASFVSHCLVAGGQDVKGYIINSQGIIDIFPLSRSTREILAIKMCFVYMQKNSWSLKKWKTHDGSLDLIAGIIQVMSSAIWWSHWSKYSIIQNYYIFLFLSHRKFFWRFLLLYLVLLIFALNFSIPIFYVHLIFLVTIFSSIWCSLLFSIIIIQHFLLNQ